MGCHIELPEGAYHVVTALEHCAWPNLTMLPGGEIGAAIFNQPCHGLWEGDLELWVSADAGETWTLRGQITRHEPPTVRMNVAAGLNAAGHLVALCSGWEMDGTGPAGRGRVLAPWVCISEDQGYTWEQVGELRPTPDEMQGLERAAELVPFGVICFDGSDAVVSCYGTMRDEAGEQGTCSIMLRSSDGGVTWQVASVIGRGKYNETDLLVPSSGPWLAVVRLAGVPTDEPGFAMPANVRLFRSQDRGATWTAGEYVSVPGQHPGHLLELADGRILLVYGSRIPCFRGVMGRISADGGQSWGTPFVIVGGLLGGDLGYPSSAQVASGEVVTAYYANCAPWHRRYHMGVVRWSLDAVPVG
jgi:hypothetical protein